VGYVYIEVMLNYTWTASLLHVLLNLATMASLVTEENGHCREVAIIEGFCSMKKLGVFLFQSGWDDNHCRVTPSINTHLYSWEEREAL